MWDGCDESGVRVSSGIYICVVRSGQQFHAVKMVLQR